METENYSEIRIQKPANHEASKRRLNRIKGQLDAIARMIDEREYCPNIVQQIRAAKNALQGFEIEILETHIRGCVYDAIKAHDAEEAKKKIDEIMNLMKR